MPTTGTQDLHEKYFYKEGNCEHVVTNTITFLIIKIHTDASWADRPVGSTLEHTAVTVSFVLMFLTNS